MDKEEMAEESKSNKELVSKKNISGSNELQPLEKYLHHTDQQEGNMNNGELGANLSSKEESSKPSKA